MYVLGFGEVCSIQTTWGRQAPSKHSKTETPYLWCVSTSPPKTRSYSHVNSLCLQPTLIFFLLQLKSENVVLPHPQFLRTTRREEREEKKFFILWSTPQMPTFAGARAGLRTLPRSPCEHRDLSTGGTTCFSQCSNRKLDWIRGRTQFQAL